MGGKKIDMEIKEMPLKGAFLLKCFRADDERGSFIKLFNKDEYTRLGIGTVLEEVYYSISQKNVIRGMHFQMPPYDHEKIVHVISGSVIDVIVDLRKESGTYGQYAAVELSENNNLAVFIPRGFAHGFKSTRDNTIMLYQVSSGYNRDCDMGIAYNSFDYDWKVDEPIISQRDKQFIDLSSFSSPF